MNPFQELEDRIASGEMTPRDVAVYGMLCAMVASGHDPTLADVGTVIGTRRDRHKSARRAVRKLEALGLVRRENRDGAAMRIVVHLPAGG